MENNINSSNTPKAEMTLEWVASKIDAIINDNAYIADAIKTLTLMDSDGHNSKAEAIHEVVQARESTNRETLKFLEKIYDGLKSPSVNPETVIKQIDIAELAELMDGAEIVEVIKAMMH